MSKQKDGNEILYAAIQNLSPDSTLLNVRSNPTTPEKVIVVVVDKSKETAIDSNVVAEIRQNDITLCQK